MSAKDDYLKWRRTSAVGCVFARFMATNKEKYGQRLESVSGNAPAKVAAKVSAHVDAHVLESSASVSTFVMPGLTTLASVVEFVQALGGLPKWIVKTWNLDVGANGPSVGFGIARHIPFAASECPSEALILGPFDDFPETRRAPVTAFELFVGTPMPLDPKSRLPTKKANLAHVDLSPMTEAIIKKNWTNSIVGRRRSLGINVPIELDEHGQEKDVPTAVDDHRAKAKVAFAIPTTLATSLGIQP